MAVPSLRPLAALSLLLVACANTVGPDAPVVDAAAADTFTAPDAALPDLPPSPDIPSRPDVPLVFVDAPLPVDRPPADVPAPPVDAPPGTPCERSFILAAGARVSHAAITPVEGGFAMAWVLAAGGTTVARVYDNDLTPVRPVGIPLELPSPAAAPDSLSLSFSGDTGIVAAGSSLHVITRSVGTLSLSNTLDLAPRVTRAAWARTATDFRVVTSDTSLIFTNGARMSSSTPNDPGVASIGAGASVIPEESSGGYVALEDLAGRLRMRRFIIGHGSVIQVGDEAGDDASASRVVSTPAGLFRLIYRGAREVDVALEARDPETLALRGTPTPLHTAAAWNVTTGAIASAGDELFMAWAAKPPSAGYNSSLQAQWGLRGTRFEAFRNTADRTIHVFAAAVDSSSSRAWVIFGEADPAGGYQLRGQCVAR